MDASKSAIACLSVHLPLLPAAVSVLGPGHWRGPRSTPPAVCSCSSPAGPREDRERQVVAPLADASGRHAMGGGSGLFRPEAAVCGDRRAAADADCAAAVTVGRRERRGAGPPPALGVTTRHGRRRPADADASQNAVPPSAVCMLPCRYVNRLARMVFQRPDR